MRNNIKKILARFDKLAEKISEDHLIRFDHRSLLLIIFCFAFFSLAVAFKLHGSSVPIWDKNLKEDGAGWVLGKPKAIRSDEWLTQTPEILSQAERGFPLENGSIGGEKAPLIRDYPVSHFVSFFKPHHWGFFILDVERGFSWFWNFKICGIFLSFFLLFMVLTRSNFWLSAFGSFWVLFSNFTQWWFSVNMSQMLVYFALMTVSAAYLFFSRRNIFIALSSVALFLSFLAFVFLFYPPFQVPLFWLSFAILAGLFFRNKKYFKNLLPLKIFLLAIVIFASSFTFFKFYGDAKDTISAATGTSYPGKRISTGGEVSPAQYFSGFFGHNMSERKFPKKMGNVCEASSFVFFFPLVILAAGYNFFKKRKNDPVLAASGIYLIVLSAYILFGFLPFLAKVSLLDMSPGSRAIMGIGVAGIISAVMFLANKEDYAWIDLRKKHLSYIFILTAAALFLTSRGLGNFPKFLPLVISVFIFTFLFYWFLKRKTRLFCVSLSLVVFYSTFNVNPVSSGLSPIFEKELYKKVLGIKNQNPDAKWLVFGSHKIADFLKSAGVEVVNGSKFPPDIASIKELSAKLEDEKIYNSFAHISFEADESEAGIFERVQFDSYKVGINPCSKRLEKIGVKYIVFADPIEKEKYLCLSKEPFFEAGKIKAYRLP